MDVDFWATRVGRHIPSAQSTRHSNYGNHTMKEEEGADEVRAWFPCPFCYMEIEVPMLCIHLQEEHCFNLKNAVCPICAANLGKDALGHFTLQHAHSIKRRKKSQKSGLSTNTIKDWRELTRSFLGANSLTGQGSGNEAASDPLLSPFLCNVPLTAPQDGHQKEISSSVTGKSDAERKPSPPDEVEGQDCEERRQRAAFVQELMLSTIF